MSAAHAGRRHNTSSGAHGRPVPIRDAMLSLVRDLGIAPKMAQYDVIAAWPDVVGPQIARVADPERMENGILYVAVKLRYRTQRVVRCHSVFRMRAIGVENVIAEARQGAKPIGR